MACWTEIDINLDDTDLNRRARKRLGLPETGPLTPEEAAKVRQEAGLLKAQDTVRRLDPRAIVRRKAGKLIVTVNR